MKIGSLSTLFAASLIMISTSNALELVPNEPSGLDRTSRLSEAPGIPGCRDLEAEFCPSFTKDEGEFCIDDQDFDALGGADLNLLKTSVFGIQRIDQADIQRPLPERGRGGFLVEYHKEVLGCSADGSATGSTFYVDCAAWCVGNNPLATGGFCKMSNNHCGFGNNSARCICNVGKAISADAHLDI